MKIELDLPDWVAEKNLYIFAGVEIVAGRRPGDPWKIKAVRCNNCGKCCMNVPKDWLRGEKDGNCQHLEYSANEARCKLGAERPFNCCIDDDSHKDYCCIEWR